MSRITRIPYTPSEYEHTREIRLDILDVNQAWCTVHKTTKPDTTSDAEFASIIATYTDLSEQFTHNGLKTRLLNLHGKKVELIKAFGCNGETLIFSTPSPTSLGVSYSLGAKVRLCTDENLSGEKPQTGTIIKLPLVPETLTGHKLRTITVLWDGETEPEEIFTHYLITQRTE